MHEQPAPTKVRFDDFTDRSRKCIAQAQAASVAIQDDHISPLHLWVGVLDNVDEEVASTAILALVDQGISCTDLRKQIVATCKSMQQARMGPGIRQFTAHAKQVLALADAESMRLADAYIGTGHILLGLLACERYPGRDVIVKTGINIDRTRLSVQQVMAESANKDRIPVPFSLRGDNVPFVRRGTSGYPYPVYDEHQRQWTAEWPGGLRQPDLWFPSEDDARAWCEKMIASWK